MKSPEIAPALELRILGDPRKRRVIEILHTHGSILLNSLADIVARAEIGQPLDESNGDRSEEIREDVHEMLNPNYTDVNLTSDLVMADIVKVDENLNVMRGSNFDRIFRAYCHFALEFDTDSELYRVACEAYAADSNIDYSEHELNPTPLPTDDI